MRLSQELIVELHVNRGAFVARPTQQDLRDVFAVRRALERAIAVQLSERFAGQPIAALRGHLASEAKARAAGDRATLARLTGEFHVLLAETHRQSPLQRQPRRLAALDRPRHRAIRRRGDQRLSEHEHGDIVAAIEAGDAKRAERLMLTHLDHVEHGIRPPDAVPVDINFQQIFGVPAPAPKAAMTKGKRSR